MVNGHTGDLLMYPDADEADGEIFDISDAERMAFDVEQTHVVLWYSSQGFMTMTYTDAEDAANLLAEYDTKE